jgi:hypothetical protein
LRLAGLRTAIDGFGSVDAFAQYRVLVKLSPLLSEIFASDTSEFAKLFSSYLTARNPPGATTVAPPPREKAETAVGGTTQD